MPKTGVLLLILFIYKLGKIAPKIRINNLREATRHIRGNAPEKGEVRRTVDSR